MSKPNGPFLTPLSGSRLATADDEQPTEGPSPRALGESLAALAAKVADLRGQVHAINTRLDQAGLRAEVNLATRFEELARTVAGALDAAAPGGPAAPYWIGLDRDTYHARLADLRRWADVVLRQQYSGDELGDCWPRPAPTSPGPWNSTTAGCPAPCAASPTSPAPAPRSARRSAAPPTTGPPVLYTADILRRAVSGDVRPGPGLQAPRAIFTWPVNSRQLAALKPRTGPRASLVSRTSTSASAATCTQLPVAEYVLVIHASDILTVITPAVADRGTARTRPGSARPRGDDQTSSPA